MKTIVCAFIIVTAIMGISFMAGRDYGAIICDPRASYRLP